MIEAVKRAVIVMKMRNEHGIEARSADLLVVKPDVGERVAIAAERIFENRVESDQRAIAFKDVAGVKNPGYFQRHLYR